MKQKVKVIVTNWRFSPPFDGFYGQVISENYEIGIDGVEDIIENEPKNGLQKWNYVVRKSNGTAIRLFNVNEVIYYANS